MKVKHLLTLVMFVCSISFLSAQTACIQYYSGPNIAIPGLNFKLKVNWNSCPYPSDFYDYGQELNHDWRFPDGTYGGSKGNTNYITSDKGGTYKTWLNYIPDQCKVCPCQNGVPPESCNPEDKWAQTGSYYVTPLSQSLVKVNNGFLYAPDVTLKVNSNASSMIYSISWYRKDGTSWIFLFNQFDGNTYTPLVGGKYYMAKVTYYYEGKYSYKVATGQIWVANPPESPAACVVKESGPGVYIPGIPTTIRQNWSVYSDCTRPDGQILDTYWTTPSGSGGGGDAPATVVAEAPGWYQLDVRYIPDPCSKCYCENGEPNGSCNPEDETMTAGSTYLPGHGLQLSSTGDAYGSTINLTYNPAAQPYITEIRWYNNDVMQDNSFDGLTSVIAYQGGKWYARVTFEHDGYTSYVSTNSIFIDQNDCISVTNGVTVAIPGMAVELGLAGACAGYDPPYLDLFWKSPKTTYNGTTENANAAVTFNDARAGYYFLYGRKYDPNFGEDRNKKIGSYYLPRLVQYIHSNGTTGNIPVNSTLSIFSNFPFQSVRWYSGTHDNYTLVGTGNTYVANTEGQRIYARVKYEVGLQVAEVVTSTVLIGSEQTGCAVMTSGISTNIPGMTHTLSHTCTDATNPWWISTYSGRKVVSGSTELEAYKPGRYYLMDFNSAGTQNQGVLGMIYIAPFEQKFTVNGGDYVHGSKVILGEGKSSVNLCYTSNVDTYIESIEWKKNGRILSNQTSACYNGLKEPGLYTITPTFKAGTQRSSIGTYFIVFGSDLQVSYMATDHPLILNATIKIENYYDFDPNQPYEWYKDGVLISGETGPTITVDESGIYMASAVTKGSNPTRLLSNEINIDTRADVNSVTTYAAQIEGIKDVTTLKSSPIEDVSVSRQYFDGIGRPIQTISKQASPMKKDIVAVQDYGAFGREEKQYLPFVRNSTDGLYKYIDMTDVNNELYQFYQGENDNIPNTSVPYAQKVFEASPLDRVLEVGEVGENWQIGTGNTVKTTYRTNTSTDNVKIWTVTNDVPSSTETYEEGVLNVVEVESEDGNVSLEFSNREGNTVLKRRVLGAGDYLDTYFVFNDLGQLLYVIPPKVAN
ncbi:Cell well associated RhsD protein [Fulvivirga imtechensis AK7]|uniref:Cell well associated RhsD protein n=1 Tax=Fulvivirga imtechensis AK7 TaxID=1237149 RepID=L8JIT6_9BACT|nr:DUF6443 domain-containing protein [Fulvivirga imtechensis]ELR68725.1 Cell well associated RhsD protein [Fulvivirga imtechensis AK7]